MEDGHETVELRFTHDASMRLGSIVDKATQLQELRGVSCRTEAIRNALRLYEWYLDKKLQGYELVVQRDGEATTVEFLFA